MRYHLTLIRMAIKKKTKLISISKDEKKSELSNTVGENVKCTATVENSIEIP